MLYLLFNCARLPMSTVQLNVQPLKWIKTDEHIYQRWRRERTKLTKKTNKTQINNRKSIHTNQILNWMSARRVYVSSVVQWSHFVCIVGCYFVFMWWILAYLRVLLLSSQIHFLFFVCWNQDTIYLYIFFSLLVQWFTVRVRIFVLNVQRFYAIYFSHYHRWFETKSAN